jgi:hypothetical protein
MRGVLVQCDRHFTHRCPLPVSFMILLTCRDESFRQREWIQPASGRHSRQTEPQVVRPLLSCVPTAQSVTLATERAQPAELGEDADDATHGRWCIPSESPCPRLRLLVQLGESSPERVRAERVPASVQATRFLAQVGVHRIVRSAIVQTQVDVWGILMGTVIMMTVEDGCSPCVPHAFGPSDAWGAPPEEPLCFVRLKVRDRHQVTSTACKPSALPAARPPPSFICTLKSHETSGISSPVSGSLLPPSLRLMPSRSREPQPALLRTAAARP